MSDYQHPNADRNLMGVQNALKYDADGEPSLRVSVQEIDLVSETGTGTALPVTQARYATDAWGRPKSILDYSIFSATWTFGIPARIWEEVNYDLAVPANNGPKPTFVNATSREGMLSVASGTTNNVGTVLRSKSYARYQPNRGQLYSTAVTIPTAKTGIGFATWGLGTAQNGTYFGIFSDGTDDGWDMRVSRWKGGVNQEAVSIKDAILAKFPDFDPTKGHVYDIQFEWRGVGNYYFFIDLELIYTMEILGTLDYLSIQDPALAVSYATAYQDPTGTAPQYEILSGCVDVSSEGGAPQKTVFASTSTGDALINLGNTANTDVAILALRIPRTIPYDGGNVFNSRGAIMDKLVTWTRDEALTKVYMFRDTNASNLDGLTWGNTPDSSIEFLTGGYNGSISALQSAFVADKASGSIVLSEWADLDAKNIIENPATNSDFKMAPGDILVVAINCIGANKYSAATLYYSEEI